MKRLVWTPLKEKVKMRVKSISSPMKKLKAGRMLYLFVAVLVHKNLKHNIMVKMSAMLACMHAQSM